MRSDTTKTGLIIIQISTMCTGMLVGYLTLHCLVYYMYNMANLSEKSYYIYEKANDRKLICDICNEANVRSPRFESWLDQNSYFVLVLNLAIKDNRKLHFSKGC